MYWQGKVCRQFSLLISTQFIGQFAHPVRSSYYQSFRVYKNLVQGTSNNIFIKQKFIINYPLHILIYVLICRKFKNKDKRFYNCFAYLCLANGFNITWILQQIFIFSNHVKLVASPLPPPPPTPSYWNNWW